MYAFDITAATYEPAIKSIDKTALNFENFGFFLGTLEPFKSSAILLFLILKLIIKLMIFSTSKKLIVVTISAFGEMTKLTCPPKSIIASTAM